MMAPARMNARIGEQGKCGKAKGAHLSKNGRGIILSGPVEVENSSIRYKADMLVSLLPQSGRPQEAHQRGA